MLYEKNYSDIVDKYTTSSFLKTSWNQLLKHAQKFPTNCRILEIGCNKGEFISMLHHSLPSSKIVGIDINPQAIAQCQKKGRSCILASAESLPFAAKSFDYIFSSHTLEHVPNLPQALQEIYRVLKPKGKAYVIVPPNWYGLETVRVALTMQKDTKISINKLFSVMDLCKKLHPTSFGYPWGRAVQTTQKLLDNYRIPLSVTGGMKPSLFFANELIFTKTH